MNTRRSLAKRVLPDCVENELERIFAQHNGFRADGKKGKASAKTRLERRSILRLCFAQLWEMGYRLRTPRSLGERHIRILAGRWEQEAIGASTLRSRMSNLKAFAEWIGKTGMVGAPSAYFSEDSIKRTQIAKENRAWKARKVDPEEVIGRAMVIDERLALYLSLQHYFGFRVKESIEFRPVHALVERGAAVEIYEGTKGGRLRRVPIETPEQRRVFDWARDVAAKSRSGRIRWPGCTFEQAQNRFYGLMSRKLGVNRRDMGITAHGLRHGFAQQMYGRHTGLPTPIEGGALGRIDRETHQAATLTVSKALGHGRADVVASYYGSYGHGLRTVDVNVPQPEQSFPESNELNQFIRKGAVK